MNKKILAGVALLLIAGGITFAVTRQSNENNTIASQSQESEHDHGTAEEHGHSDEDHSAMVDSIVVDACSVFSGTQLSEALGLTISDGSSDGFNESETVEGLPIVQCNWEQDGGDANSAMTVHLSVYNFTTEDAAVAELNSARITSGNLTFAEVSDVADEAIFPRSNAEGAKKVQAQLYWRSGFQVYHMSAVNLGGLDVPTVEDQVKNLVARQF